MELGRVRSQAIAADLAALLGWDTGGTRGGNQDGK